MEVIAVNVTPVTQNMAQDVGCNNARLMADVTGMVL